MLEIQTSCLKLSANMLLLRLIESAPHPPPWLELVTGKAVRIIYMFSNAAAGIFSFYQQI